MIWEKLETKELYSNSVFSISVDKCKMPDGRIMPNYFIFNFPDWVNIVALTKENKFILIKQYRHASKQVHIEIPGGSVDIKKIEDTETAAIRELKEETGYIPQKIIKIASHFPNPALQSNQTHIYLALDCEIKQKQELDPYEDIEVFLATPQEVKIMLKNGEINHTIVNSALWQTLDYLSFSQSGK